MKRKWIRTFSAFLLVVLVFAASSGAFAVSFSKKAPVMTSNRKGAVITLKWNKRSGLTGYQVFKCNSSGNNKKRVKTVKTNSTKLTVKPGSNYYYCVRGYKKRSGRSTLYTSYSSVVKTAVPVTGRKSTLKELLETGLKPIGSTMYVWGGGWNKADTGAGIEACTIGVNKNWKSFFKKQTSKYNYKNTKYQIHNGLDCSGYIGWCIYNIRNTVNGKTGYVMKASKMASNFASRGWGIYKKKDKVSDYRAGDIMSSGTHVWMVVGPCSDGSVVLMHSSPPGVRLAGTPTKSGSTNSKAIKLAKYYMKKYYPAWYQKYPNCATSRSYLTDYAQMRWTISDLAVMKDPENYRQKNAEEILRDLFSK